MAEESCRQRSSWKNLIRDDMDHTGEERTDRFLKIPASIILTKEGLDIVSTSNVVPVKIVNHMGIVREGIEAESINAQTLQKMVMSSYVEEIYSTLPDFLSYRHEIMSLNSLIVYAILYKKLGPTISDMFFHSTVVKDFNRKNPKNSIVNLQQINKKSLDEIMRRQKEYFDGLKSLVANEVVTLINLNAALTEEDKQTQRKCLDKFINWIDLRIWYIYNIICKTNLSNEMKMDMANIIAQYLNRTQIATHLSNLVMELSQNAERSHFERICIRNNLTRPGKIDEYLRKRENRDVVTKISKETKELLSISWNMNPDRNAIGQQYRIKISIANYGLVHDLMKIQMNKKIKTDVEGVSIADFYGADGSSAGLGLLYNSFLEEYCRDHGIKYWCNIVPDPKTEKTTVIIDISI
jgi:hypothetical protein